MQIPDLSATIVALATPPGVGAIGVVRLSGPRALLIADVMFKGKRLENAASHTVHFGRIVSPEGRNLDEGLATIFKNPHSYTGEDSVEFSCHGSPYILQEVIQTALAHGARMAAPGEFTLRAFLNGKLDLSQAEAVADLIASQSAGAHHMALNQLRGGFKNEIQRLREELIHFASLVELELDFSEEDVEFANRSDLRALVDKIRHYIQSLLRSFALGNAMKHGVNTVIAGRPNAGKSTLLNALLNEERAIVSDIPGTTRDTIEEVLNIDGVQFRLIDTAGIREAQDQIEAIGVQKTFEKVRDAALLVYVWDVAGGMTLAELYQDLLQLLDGAAIPCLIVCNKMDRNPLFDTGWIMAPENPAIHPYLLPEGAPLVFPEALRDAALTPVPVSAKNQMNIEFLKEKLYDSALGQATPGESTVVSNARHYDALRRADEALSDVLRALDNGITGDFIALDIRRALNCLGEISGQVDVEELLGNIFGKFCIGK